MTWFTPVCIDDFAYKYVWGGGNQQIKTLKDVLVSQHHHYYLVNGRSIVHAIAQIFEGILGKSAFNVFNTIVFTSFLFLVPAVHLGRKNVTITHISITLLLLCAVFRPFSECFVWQMGAFNSLWASVFVLGFLLLLRHSFSSKWWLLLMLYSAISGWTHEGIVFPAIAGCFFYFVFHREQLTAQRALMLLAFMVGGLLILLSPGAWHRLQETHGDGALTAKGMFISLVNVIVGLRMTWIMVLIVIWHCKKKKLRFKVFVHDNIFLTTAFIVAIALVIISGARYSRAYYGIEFYAMLITVRLMLSYHIAAWVPIVGNCVIIIAAFPVLFTARQAHAEEMNIERQIMTNHSHIITTDEVKTNWLTENFILHPYTPEADDHYDLYMSDSEAMQYYKRGFNRSELIMLPSRFLADINAQPHRYAKFSRGDDLPFYAKRLRKDETVRDTLTFVLRPTEYDDLPFYLRRIAPRLARYANTEVETSKHAIVVLNGTRYLLVGRNAMVDKRVVDIRY